MGKTTLKQRRITQTLTKRKWKRMQTRHLPKKQKMDFVVFIYISVQLKIIFAISIIKYVVYINKTHHYTFLLCSLTINILIRPNYYILPYFKLHLNDGGNWLIMSFENYSYLFNLSTNIWKS